jgi:hypothetical protein
VPGWNFPIYGGLRRYNTADLNTVPSSWDWLTTRTSIGSKDSPGPTMLYNATYDPGEIDAEDMLRSCEKSYAKFAPSIGAPGISYSYENARNRMRLDFIQNPFLWFDVNKSYEIYPLHYVTDPNRSWFESSVSSSMLTDPGATDSMNGQNIPRWVRAFAKSIDTGWKK